MERDRALMTWGEAGMEPVVAKASRSASSFPTLFFVSFPDFSMLVSYIHINALKIDLIKSISYLYLYFSPPLFLCYICAENRFLRVPQADAYLPVPQALVLALLKAWYHLVLSPSGCLGLPFSYRDRMVSP